MDAGRIGGDWKWVAARWEEGLEEILTRTTLQENGRFSRTSGIDFGWTYVRIQTYFTDISSNLLYCVVFDLILSNGF
jgi:hypothetical protein